MRGWERGLVGDEQLSSPLCRTGAPLVRQPAEPSVSRESRRRQPIFSTPPLSCLAYSQNEIPRLWSTRRMTTQTHSDAPLVESEFRNTPRRTGRPNLPRPLRLLIAGFVGRSAGPRNGRCRAKEVATRARASECPLGLQRSVLKHWVTRPKTSP
ncbi:hypothetical protein CC85DRAFT_138366 [Cutaneotrichosporon oleaginosum]|uniref:Uncharacterized protein n=1 Tax=Cutaneotrichosporon oleaginosum TaxID=879819 RepID=A0A0J0XIL5_9TREE|nr:uncharacterized protein CC85DRAFT_138366 [Cutaneotrichosporon oleaginosum]KLT40931.1 hypothetical protein CC85DRAFT_138366 [Cutaneotrichosporon oleaginosum]TXT15424.1 hypothetical protein COLE_01617 [Cutaneotrichosporon oleaginosum]